MVTTDGIVVTVCLCCGKIHHDGEPWHDGTPDPGDQQSHGYCQQCAPTVMREWGWTPEMIENARARGII